MLNLQKLLGRGSDQPVQDARDAQKIIEDLPPDDTLSAVEELSGWLAAVRQATGYKPATLLAVVAKLDEAGQPLARQLSRQYLDAPRMTAAREGRMWLAIGEFWRQVGEAYALIAASFDARGDGHRAIEKEIPLVLVRSAIALADQVKWRHVRYRTVEAAIWASLAKVLYLAETYQLTRATLSAYPGHQARDSVLLHSLRALVLDVSSPGSLSPIQVDLADQAALQMAGAFTFTQRPEPDSVFYIDWSAKKSPGRLIKGMPINGEMRFFGGAAAAQRLKTLMTRLTQKESPRELGFSGYAKEEDLARVLDHLAQQWSPVPPQRTSLRKKVMARLKVVRGFKEIRRRVANQERRVLAAKDDKDIFYQERLDLKLYGFVTQKTVETQKTAAVARAPEVEEEAESWIMENVSAGGYGAIIPDMADDWLRIGSLLALQPDGSSRWSLGVVRRLTRDSQLRVYVGIQTLGQEPVSVRLRPLGSTASVWELVSDVPSHDYVAGLLLPAMPGRGESASLLLEPGTFVEGKVFDLLRGETRDRIKIDRLMEDTGDCQRVCFSTIAPPGKGQG